MFHPKSVIYVQGCKVREKKIQSIKRNLEIRKKVKFTLKFNFKTTSSEGIKNLKSAENMKTTACTYTRLNNKGYMFHFIIQIVFNIIFTLVGDDSNLWIYFL